MQLQYLLWVIIAGILVLAWRFGRPVQSLSVTKLGLPENLPQKPVLIEISKHRYSPQRVIVDPGTLVVWKNMDRHCHTVTSIYDPIVLQSPALKPGETYKILFNRPGTHPYRCRRHPFMKGVVTVRGDPAENLYW